MSDLQLRDAQEISGDPRGQSLVEFALVLPMLLVLLLGIADFGRVFQAGIALEAAARNAAEVGALERLRNPPPADPSLHDGYYRDLHATIAAIACEEMTVLAAPDDHVAGPACEHLSAVSVCIHDGVDPRCHVAVTDMGNPVPDACETLKGVRATAPGTSVSGGEVSSHKVEVALCYQFSTLFNLDFSLPLNSGLSLGDVFLERNRVFVVDCPPSTVATC